VALFESIKGMMKPKHLRNDASPFPSYTVIPYHNVCKTDANAYIPYGLAAYASDANVSAVIVLIACYSSRNPCSIISTRLLRCGSIAQPIKTAICCTILMPVCHACQLFLDWHTAFKNGSICGIPSENATTAKALAVVFLI